MKNHSNLQTPEKKEDNFSKYSLYMFCDFNFADKFCCIIIMETNLQSAAYRFFWLKLITFKGAAV